MQHVHVLFLPRDAMHKHALCRHAVSACVSVCVSVTFVDHVKTNNHIFDFFQDGERPPFRKSIYRHISVKNHPIFVKFCTQEQIFNWMNVT